MLRNHNCQLKHSLSHMPLVLETIENEPIDYIIIESHDELPLSMITKILLSSVFAQNKSIFVFLDPSNARELEILSYYHEVEILIKPITKLAFDHQFLKAEKKWRYGPHNALKQIINRFIVQKDHDELWNYIERYETVISNLFQASFLKAYYCEKKGLLEQGEAHLLQYIKKNSFNLTIIQYLIDIYIKYANPKMALRFLNSVQKKINHSFVFLPDIAIVNTLMGDYQDSLNVYEELLALNYYPAWAQENYVKLLLLTDPELLNGDFTRKNIKKTVISEIQSQWERDKKVL